MGVELTEQLCPQATQVLDWRHARQHVAECGKALLGEPNACPSVWGNTTETLFWRGETEVLLRELEACLFLMAHLRAAWRTAGPKYFHGAIHAAAARSATAVSSVHLSP